jgi:hypothetical protein
MKIKSCDLCTHLWASVNPCINVVVLFLITLHVVQMERSELMMNQRSSYFISGVVEFMNLVESTKKRIGDEDNIMCPCTHCANIESRVVADVEWHLLSRGFMDGYTRWTRHGEEQVMDEYTQGCEMPNPDKCHMDVESNIGAEASSYQWNTKKPKCPLEN